MVSPQAGTKVPLGGHIRSETVQSLMQVFTKAKKAFEAIRKVDLSLRKLL